VLRWPWQSRGGVALRDAGEFEGSNCKSYISRRGLRTGEDPSLMSNSWDSGGGVLGGSRGSSAPPVGRRDAGARR
jgi:hypothetical protein